MEWLRLRLGDQEGGAETWRNVRAWVEAPPDGPGPGQSSRAAAIRAEAERTAVTGAAALERGGY